jgi:hypothetical protein
VTDRSTHVRGAISSVAFDGHRFVVGRWVESPIGPMGDVMWVTDDGHRTLLVDRDAAAEFICGIYRFDDVRVAPLRVSGDARTTRVDGHGLELDLRGGRRRPVPFPRPRWFTRFLEAPIARRLMGVEAYGRSPTGAREWYQTRGWCWVDEAAGRLDGVDLGRMRPIARSLGVGFSDPPERPSIASVRVAIEPATEPVITDRAWRAGARPTGRS